MIKYSFELPIYYVQKFKTKKNKKFLISLNWYSLANRFLKNDVKKHYHKLVEEALDYASEDEPLIHYKTSYKLYYDKTNCDMMNVVSVIDKFVQDGLIEFGLINDDSVKEYNRCVIEAEDDKKNPRVFIVIEERAN